MLLQQFILVKEDARAAGIFNISAPLAASLLSQMGASGFDMFMNCGEYDSAAVLLPVALTDSPQLRIIHSVR